VAENSGSLAERLAGRPAGEWHAVALDLVVGETAALIGCPPGDLDPFRPYRELGYNSLAAIELTTMLSESSGIELAVTMLFDHPTPDAVAGHLLSHLTDAAPAPAEPVAAQSYSDGTDDDPIVLVGLGCRYPGGVRSAADLWALVAAGRDAISEFPGDRGWDLDTLFDPDPDHAGTSYSREGGFLAEATDFDAEFFGISPREALSMDPQQRLLLEVAWETLEHAGLDPNSLRGSATGVFVGLAVEDYSWLARVGPEDLGGYWGIGTAGSVASGRISYTFGFEGPAVTLDTACSSSLVALHLAADSLRRGECTLALAGGVTVLSTPTLFVEFSRQRAMAPDGRCKSFAAAADGAGWSEGVGLVALERLSDARRNGHRVLATLAGSAVNQDGASNGLTAPNGPSQERVIRSALANARLTPSDVDAVEAHGTGTTLGDPIEAQALLAVYGVDRDPDRPLWLGSLKSNIGHSQAAAGVGGVIKLVMALHGNRLPKTLHVDEPTPKVDWSTGTVALLTDAQPWEPADRPRRAAVSAFGIGGTNAHVIIEEPPADTREQAPPVPGPLPGPLPWLLSARGKKALTAQAGVLLAHVEEHLELAPADVAHTLAHQRAHLDHRAAVVGADRNELLAGLTALIAQESPDGLVRGVAGPGHGKVAFLFPGQGSQYAGMARELAEHHPVFAERLRECAAALDPHLDYSVADVLAGAPDAPGYDRVDVVQPVLFAVMVSLAELWRAHGVVPDVVVGHSQGEIAAACVSGGLSLSDAARVVALRSRALSEVTGAGGMVSVSLPVAELTPRLARWAERLSVAAVNGPSTVVVSGESAALAELLAECAEEGVWAREIPVDYASHSAYMSVLEGPLAAALAPIEPRAGGGRFHSTLTGEPIDTAGLDAGYWYRNIRETVRFEPVIRQLVEQGYRAFVEVSPHPILTVAVGQTLEAVGVDPARVAVTGTLHRDQADRTAFTTARAVLHTRGVTVDWAGLAAGAPAHLPTYAFQPQRFWVEPPVVAAGDVTAAGLVPVDHPLLSSAVRPADGTGWLFTGRLSQRTYPWLADHAVSDVVLLPGAAFVELSAYVGGLLGAGVVEELTIEAPLVVPETGAVAIQVAVGEPDGEGLRPITIHSHEVAEQVEDVEFTCHATGVLAVADTEASPELDVASWPPEGAEIPVDDLYDRLAGQGFEYGPAFQGLRAGWRSGDEVIAEVRLDAAHQAQASRFGVHPALLDAAFHAVVVRLGEQVGHASLPFSWSGVRIHRGGASSLRVRLVRTGPDSVGLFAVTESGAPVLSVRSVLARPVTLVQLTAARRSRSNSLFTVDWTPTSVAAAVRPAGRVAVLGVVDLVPGVERHDSLASIVDDPPDVLLAVFDGGAGDLAGVARATAQRALTLLQDFLADERLIDTRLVVVTTEAVALRGEQPNLGAAAVVGLARTAQAEHPGRIVLVDVDGDPATRRILPAAIAAGEPQLAIRTGAVFVPRLAKVADDEAAPPALDPHGTVLVTGGTGGIGAVVAKHLVVAHGVSRLLLVSRRGPATEGVAELVAELTALGATATVAACDVTDRVSLAAVIAAVPAGHPLTAVIHSAAVLDDGLLESFTPERLTKVLRPKIDAALHLHELTMGHNLAAFVLFSSVAGVFGGPGQGNYAAGNAFLDALAHARRATGLPATSMAWGLWADASDLTRHLSAADVTRLARSGLAALSTEDGLRLFDAAWRLPDPLVVAARLDTAAIRAKARAGDLAPMFRDLVRLPALPPSEADETLADRLAELPEEEWDAVVLDIVLSQTASVLGYPSPDSIDAERAFSELGFDSLSAVQLRNRLTAATGLALPSVLVFNHPTPAAIAGHLRSRLAKRQPSVAPDLVAQLDRLAIALGSLGGPEREPLLARLRALIAELTLPATESTADLIQSASAEELFDLIDRGLGA